MNKDIFSILNPNFFGILAGKNKTTNVLLIFEISRIFSSSLTLLKDTLVSYLAEFMKLMNIEEIDEIEDEDLYFDDEEDEDNERSKASRFIKDLINRGWLEIDQDTKLNFIVNRTDGFIKIVDALLGLINDEVRPDEYSSAILNLYQTSKNFDYNNPTSTVETMDKINKEIENNLLSINSKIKRFINEVMSKSDATEKEILTKLTVDYQKLPSFIAFHNLLTRNNPDKYIDTILDSVNNLRHPEVLNLLLNDYVLVKGLNTKEISSYEQARSYFYNVFTNIEFTMTHIGNSLNLISSRNATYVTNSKNRIRFRLNNEYDIKGSINTILKQIKDNETPNEEEIYSVFSLYSYGQIDDKSFYKPRNISRNAPKKVPLTIKVKDPALSQKAKELLEMKNMYSLDKVNEFVNLNLGEKTKAYINEFKVESVEDFIKLMLIPVYSSNSFASFEVNKPIDEEVVINGFRMKNYSVNKKKKGKRA